VATLSTTALPAGTDAATATYAAAGNFAASSSTPATLTITSAPVTPAGSYTATTTLTFTPTGGYSGTIALSSSNLPTNARCAFAQNQVTLSGNNQSMNLALNITTTQQAEKHAPQSPLNPALFALAFWWPRALTGLAIFIRKRILQNGQSSWQLCLLLVCALAFVAGLSGLRFKQRYGQQWD
jgi:hypothetical protein